VIALDTNILVYSRRRESGHHAAALKIVRQLAEGDTPWAMPWPCIYEFLRVITHPRIFDPPTDLDVALEDIHSLVQSPSLVLLGEGPAHPAHLAHMIESGRATGNLVHDAHIAALALEHGVSELWTTDKDFTRFPGLRTRDPFLKRGVQEPRRRYRMTARHRRKSARRRAG
jgi:toxin-antitoxin system PIN domain toxin